MFKRRRHTNRRKDSRRSMLFEGLDQRQMLASLTGLDGCQVDLADGALDDQFLACCPGSNDQPQGCGEGEAVSPIPVPLPQPGDVVTGADIRPTEYDDGMVDGSELSEAPSEDDDDGDEATPINLPGPVPTETPEPGPDPFPHTAMVEDASQVALDHTGPGGNVALDHRGPGGNVALDHPGTGGNLALRDIPADILSANLQPAPDYEAMNAAERAVVEIVGRAIVDEDYRTVLFSDAIAAIAGYPVTESDQAALAEIPEESFGFFAANVEARLAEALDSGSVAASPEAQQQVLKQVVHAVWRDLNPGGLAYVLAYKIPMKHLRR